MNTNGEEKMREIAEQVESEYQMGGLSDGLYFDFAKEVALRFSLALLEQMIEWAGKNAMPPIDSGWEDSQRTVRLVDLRAKIEELKKAS